MQFKVGDKVRRKEKFWDNGGWQANGKVLTVREIEYDGDIRLEGIAGGWSVSRFELVEQKPVRNLPAWF